MPILPSGRFAVLSFRELAFLGERAVDEDDASLLLFLESNSSLNTILQVYEVRPEEPADEFALTTDDGQPLHLTGLSVADVLEGRSDWSAEDVKAFAAWLEEPHVKASAKEAQDLLLEVRAEITAWACEEPPKGIRPWPNPGRADWDR
jgi:hypothetical protein